MTQLHDNIVGIDASIMMHPRVWEASGHVENFDDLMVEDTVTNERFRFDHLTEEQQRDMKSPAGNPLSEPRRFNLRGSRAITPTAARATAFRSDPGRCR